MIPLSIILNILVTLIFGIFWLASFVIFYHLTRFGIGTKPKKLAVLFLLGSVLLFSVSLVLYNTLDLHKLIQ